MTNNLSYLQVMVWIHDHGLRAEDPPWVTWKTGPSLVMPPPDPSSPMDLGMLGPRVSMLWRGQCLWSFQKLIYPLSIHPALLVLTLEAGQRFRIAIEAKRLATTSSNSSMVRLLRKNGKKPPPLMQESHSCEQLCTINILVAIGPSI